QAAPGKIDPPVVYPHQSTGQRLAVRVSLDAGTPVREVESPSHRVAVTREGGGRVRASFDGGEGDALNRDFRLRWKPGGDETEMGVLAWRDARQEGEPGVFTLILQPPEDPEEDAAEPRELICVLDCSG